MSAFDLARCTIAGGTLMALLAFLRAVRRPKRYTPRHKPHRNRDPRSVDDVSTTPLTPISSVDTMPSEIIFTDPVGAAPEEIKVDWQEPSPSPSALVFEDDPINTVTDPEEWLEPLLQGGKRAERRLTDTMRERGMIGLPRAPRKVRQQINRALRRSVEEETDVKIDREESWT